MKSAMIFAAGFGKRLHPYTLTMPKPLLPIGDTTCLERNIHMLQAFGIQHIYINIHYLPDTFHDILKKHPILTPLYEKTVLETGGGLKNAIDYLDDDMLCMNGDVWYEDTNFLHDFCQSRPRDSDVHLMLVHRNHIQFANFPGDYFYANNGLLTHTSRSKQDAPYVYAGVQIITKSTFRKFSDGKDVFSLRAYYDDCEMNGTLSGALYPHQICEIGTVESYQSLLKMHDGF